MLVVLIPLIPFICSVVLLNLNRNHSRQPIASWVGFGSILLTLGLIGWLYNTMPFSEPMEYLFSPLFNLPGSSEALSFSLFLDGLAFRWLLFLNLAMIPFQLLHSARKDPEYHPVSKLAAIHLAHAGLNTLFLAGSLVTGVIGWGLALGAIILSNARLNESDTEKRLSGFMTLMLTVFFLLMAIFLFYAATGRLSYANDPIQQTALLKSLLSTEARGIVSGVLTTAGVLLLLCVLPGLGLVPFTGWLDDTRDTHNINALFIFTCIMPSGIIMLERYAWFYSLIPGLRLIVLAVALVSLILSWLAAIGLTGGRLSLPWLAVTASSLLCLTFVLQLQQGIPLVLHTIYPGFILLGIGRILSVDFNTRHGKSLQITGLVFPPVAAAGIVMAHPADLQEILVFTGLIIAFLLPALRLYRNTPADTPESMHIASSVGWSAYAYFGFPTFLKYCIAAPIQQIAYGFWTLETCYNQFWHFGLGKLVRRWARLMWLFDCWFISRHGKKSELKVDKV